VKLQNNEHLAGALLVALESESRPLGFWTHNVTHVSILTSFQQFKSTTREDRPQKATMDILVSISIRFYEKITSRENYPEQPSQNLIMENINADTHNLVHREEEKRNQ